MGPLNNYVPLIGEFVVKVASLETTIDHMLLQAVAHFGAPYKTAYEAAMRRIDLNPKGGMPSNFEAKAVAWTVLITNFIIKPPSLDGAPFRDRTQVVELILSISRIRNSLLHSSYTGFFVAEEIPVFELERYKRHGKGQDGHTYALHVETLPCNEIVASVAGLDFLLVYAELCIAALNWEFDGWNVAEMKRAESIPVRHFDVPKMVRAMASGGNPFEVVKCL